MCRLVSVRRSLARLAMTVVVRKAESSAVALEGRAVPHLIESAHLQTRPDAMGRVV